MVDNIRLPKASIIIVNMDGLHHLKRCLPSICRQVYPDYEVLVIDNASSDGSVGYVQRMFPSVKIVQNNENLGYAGANNVGFQHASGEYLAVLNPDTYVEPDWLVELVGALQRRPGAGLATPKILLMDDPDRINTCGNEITFSGLTFCRGLEHSRESFNIPEVVSAISGAAFVIKRSVLEHIGGFDEEYFIYYEETDLSLRAMLAGYECYYVPDAVIYHQYSFRTNPNKVFYQERNRYFSLLKTFRWRTILALLPSLLVADLVAWGYAILKGPGYMVSKLRVYVWLLGNLRRVLAARREVQSLRRVDDRVLLERFGHRMNFTQTTRPWLARALDRTVNPVLSLLRKASLGMVTW